MEFALGLGITAQMILAKEPKSYTGVDLNEKAVAHLKYQLGGESREFILGNTSDTGLAHKSYSKVCGEAILSMQSTKNKKEIIKEASRILENGGLYGIHELGLFPTKLMSI